MKTLLLAALASTTAFAALPAVGRDYARPAAPLPAAYRDAAPTAATWKTAHPADAEPRGAWWRLFSDPVLDYLETTALAGNYDLQAAAARVVQARASAGLIQSDAWPHLAAGGSFTRARTSSTTANVFPDTLTNSYQVPLTAGWEIDLFGRLRRANQAARADAEASAATFEAVRLALTADVASTYFSLRASERERALLQNTARLRRRALELENVRLHNGTAAETDVARAETEYATAEADAAAVANRDAALQDRLAVLVGQPASDFRVLTAAPDTAKPDFRPAIPTVPPGLPSELLERRPDIAAAERAVAAASARIGVAKAAFFPAISLTGSAGYASAASTDLLGVDSRIWSFGPSIYLPIFQGGRNRANLQRSRAAFEEAVAGYRQHVLLAVRDVQDALAATRLLAEQSAAQDRALAAARRAAKLAQARYNAGYVSYLDVIDAQRTALAIERASVQLQAQRLNASVALIEALGGGWRAPAYSAASASRSAEKH